MISDCQRYRWPAAVDNLVIELVVTMTLSSVTNWRFAEVGTVTELVSLPIISAPCGLFHLFPTLLRRYLCIASLVYNYTICRMCSCHRCRTQRDGLVDSSFGCTTCKVYLCRDGEYFRAYHDRQLPGLLYRDEYRLPLLQMTTPCRNSSGACLGSDYTNKVFKM